MYYTYNLDQRKGPQRQYRAAQFIFGEGEGTHRMLASVEALEKVSRGTVELHDGHCHVNGIPGDSSAVLLLMPNEWLVCGDDHDETGWYEILDTEQFNKYYVPVLAGPEELAK